MYLCRLGERVRRAREDGGENAYVYEKIGWNCVRSVMDNQCNLNFPIPILALIYFLLLSLSLSLFLSLSLCVCVCVFVCVCACNVSRSPFFLSLYFTLGGSLFAP